MKIRLFSSAIFLNRTKSGIFPNRDGIINAQVLLVIDCSISFTLTMYVLGSTSTKTGVNPFFIIGESVVANVSIGVITSASSGTSKISNANKLADEPELTIVPNSLPNKTAIFCSNFLTFSPIIVL